jgi:tetratricopeptide (TPR) repeat protein
MLRRLAIAAAAVLSLAASAPRASAARRSAGPKVDEPRKVDPAESAGQEASKHYQFGNQYFQQGLLRQADTELRKAMAIQPAYPDAAYLLGLVSLELNDFRGALALGERALADNPFLTEAHNLMGLAHARMGNLDLALQEFEAVKGDVSFPTPEIAHFNIGKVFWEREAWGDAVIHFRRALEINPDFWRAWALMGDCQEMLGQTPQARASYEKVLQQAPNEVKTMYRLGFLCFQDHDFACARQWFDKVRELSPSSEEAAGAREYIRQMNFR